ncbi:hypothetical protein CAPTEDRAFT_190302 [Capitella teleta]|uniref:Myb-like domain-containing protein n=1 Tax=Capitella teleta TaxID=283909 RepID=R7V4F9_CAPTE|nr:hypothetical protein CAPTEDRAFT_190302 [Capitella teleta]|eukprot:ELU13718.1 hypothetical protein CAPTEDRAFT_190302 [Capitella teleta]
MSSECRTDLELLVEYAKCQSDNPSAQAQAFRSIASLCSKQAPSQKELSTPQIFAYLKDVVHRELTPMKTRKSAAFLLLCLVKNNKENQRLCANVLPFVLKSILNQTDTENLRQLVTFVGAITTENEHNQDRVNQCNGLDVMVHALLRSTVRDIKQQMPLVLAIIGTIDNLVSENHTNKELCHNLGLVPILLRVLQVENLDTSNCLLVIVTLSHLVENSTDCQDDVLSNRGIDILMKCLSSNDNQELTYFVKYVLSSCMKKGTSEFGSIANGPNISQDISKTFETGDSTNGLQLNLKAKLKEMDNLLNYTNIETHRFSSTQSRMDYISDELINSSHDPNLTFKKNMMGTQQVEKAGRRFLEQPKGLPARVNESLSLSSPSRAPLYNRHELPKDVMQMVDLNTTIALQELRKALEKEKTECLKLKQEMENIRQVNTTDMKQKEEKAKRSKDVTNKKNRRTSSYSNRKTVTSEMKEQPSLNRSHNTTSNASFCSIGPRTSTPKQGVVFKKPQTPPLSVRKNARMKNVKRCILKTEQSDLVSPPSPCLTEFDLNLRQIAKNSQNQADHRAVHTWLQKSFVSDARIEMSGSASKETKCPGCQSAQYLNSNLLNSRDFNIALEVNHHTCTAHRTLREEERKILRKINDISKQDRLLPMKKRILQRSNQTKIEDDVYAFDSKTSDESISPPSPPCAVKKCKSRSTPTRRSRIPYSEDEIINLENGVASIGRYWNQILFTYKFHPSRTAVDLKEKYSRLHKTMNVSSMSINSDRNQRKKKKQAFSMVEERRLRRGVSLYGFHWKTILGAFKFSKDRTAADLRNKWRIMAKL